MHILNAEISRLPGGANDPLLTAAREAVITKFGDINGGSGLFRLVKNLIPIKISSSLFFGIDHGKWTIGFSVHMPQTAWEIHPATGLHFLDD
jgi:hypothetical protein